MGRSHRILWDPPSIVSRITIVQQSPMMGFVDRQSDLIPIEMLTRG